MKELSDSPIKFNMSKNVLGDFMSNYNVVSKERSSCMHTAKKCLE